MLCDCHIFNHTTVPELCNICCVILQVQRRRGGEKWDVRVRKMRIEGEEMGEIKEAQKRIDQWES